MKILAISNISGAVERVADMFENTNASVMAKEEANDIAGIRDKISAAFSKGIYDYAVVVVEDYISATAILNKSDEITAAVFDSEDDMAFLNGSKVNTLIIKASRKTLTFLGILTNVHASSGRKSEASSTAKAEKLAAKAIDWKRYAISNFDEEPISVFVNVSSVYVPYSGVGKQAVSQEEEIIDEIKLAVQDCARALQRYLSGIRNQNLRETRYKTIMRYVSQLSGDLSDITGVKKEEIEKNLKKLVEERFSISERDEENQEGEISEKQEKEEEDEE